MRRRLSTFQYAQRTNESSDDCEETQEHLPPGRHHTSRQPGSVQLQEDSGGGEGNEHTEKGDGEDSAEVVDGSGICGVEDGEEEGDGKYGEGGDC